MERSLVNRLHVLVVTAWLGAALFSYVASAQTAPARQPPPPDPLIEITPVRSGISVTSENQILVEFLPEDLDPANLLDLAGRTVVFTPDGRGGYWRSVRDVALEEDIGEEPSSDRQEIELDFPFEFSGRKWRSFFVTGNGLITFGKPFPSWDSGTPSRFGTMQIIADAFLVAPTISALYKPHLGGRTYVSSKLDRVVVTWEPWDRAFAVYGRRPKEALRYQIALHSDGSVALHYGPQPADADEAIRDGIVGLFPQPSRPACSGAFPTRWTAPFPATWTWWKPPSTRPPTHIS